MKKSNLNEIEQILAFIVEIEKLKNVHRKTKPVGLQRYENSAEHSWHVCISALMLKEYADEDIDINRVIRMLLIHDLGEIDAGDTIIYESENPELKEEEAKGVRRILDMLPNDQSSEEFFDLWLEFEQGKTADARYARAIDRIPPLFHNIHGEGHSWQTYGVNRDKVMQVNQRIAYGSRQVWELIRTKLDQAVKDKILSDD